MRTNWKQRKDGQATRRRLLVSAGRVFANRGYRSASIADICAAARANIAAANYYFGSKQALYVAAWEFCMRRSIEKHPADGGVPSEAPPEARFRGRIRSLMHRILDPDSHGFDIVHKEMANPTGLLADSMRKATEPLQRDFLALIGELLGPRADAAAARLCHMSILAQCFGPLLRLRRRRASPHGGHPPCSDLPFEDVETLVEHVVNFSLAGLREMRRRAARTGGTSRSRKNSKV